MIRGIYTAVSGLITQEAKQDVVTNNLANAATVGFKSDNLSIKKFDDVLIQNKDKIVGGKNVKTTIGSLSMGSKVDELNTAFTQGMIQNTDKATDFAIDGRGFFTVRRNDGAEYYTRDGHFHVNTAGMLVTDSGDAVMGTNANGNREPINVGRKAITADENGNISLDGVNSYKMAVVDFQNYSGLQKIGDNLYQGTNPIQNPNVFVKQRSLEKSNVNVMNEMVNMMTIMRSFETNQKVVQSLDETLGKAVNDVGRV